MKKNAADWKGLMLLQGGAVIYAVSAVLSKTAAGFRPMSAGFLAFYGLSLLALALYAVIWQQALRRFPLSVAFANRSAAMVWTLLFGALLFGETPGPRQFIGVLVIVAGVALTVAADD